MDFASLFRSTVERYPDRVALVYGERRWTYAEWFGRVGRFAQALADLGVRPGDRVAFYVSTSENSVTTYFACQLLGAVAVPLNFRLAAGEVRWILADAGARVLVYGRHLTEPVARVAETLNSVHDWISCAWDAGNVPAGHHHFDTLAEDTVDRRETRPIPAPDDLSALVYTSGTTGRPKGVMHTHANDAYIAMNCVMEYGLNRRDRALHIAPLYHVGGMQAFFIPHMMVGGTNVVLGRYEAAETLETIERERITTLFAVPTQIREMLDHPDFARRDTSSLKLITTGGAAIPEAVMRRVIDEFCPNVYNGYGMTEASLTLLLHPEDAVERLGSCGRPTLISRCRVIKVDPGREVAPSEMTEPGEIGQLIVHGPQVMKGYWNNPFETQRKLKAGWVYTGDLFSRDAHGFYFFHGRADDTIVSGGENIHPREIEEVLHRAPGVAAVAVVGLPDERWGQLVTAFVVRRDGQGGDVATDAAALDAYCRASDELAPYKRPRRYEFVDALPINPSGKVLRRELVALAGAAAPPAADPSSPGASPR